MRLKRGEGMLQLYLEREDKCLLGMTALEALGLEVDVVTGKLKPMELLLL